VEPDPDARRATVNGADGVALLIRLAALAIWVVAFLVGLEIETTGVRILIGLIILLLCALALGGFAVIGAVPPDLSRVVYTAVATASGIVGIAFILEGRRGEQ
jgi:hypothetical protein